MNTLLSIKNLSLSYQTKEAEIQAIKGLTFSVKRGEFVAIIGRSGCGKTSILSVIAGLIPYGEGEIKLNLTENKSDYKIGYMLQKDELFPWLTIEQNALLPLKIKSGAVRKEDKEYVIDLLNKYELSAFRHSFPSQLSGGMRQRAALIRTLAGNPELLLLDEPFSALDYQTRLSVCDDVYDIIRRENKTALLVTHDISEAISVADRVLVLTARPASVYSENSIDLDKNDSPLKRREKPSFSTWFEKLWRELNS